MSAAQALLSRPRAPGQLGLLWQLVRRSFLRTATYRAATVAGLFTNGVFGFLRSYVLLAVLAVQPGIAGYDATDAVTYVFLTQGLLAVVYSFGVDELALRIRSGDVVADLYRPVDFQLWWLALDLGRAGFQTMARGVPQLLIGAAAFGIQTPPDALVWVGFVLSVAVAVVVSFAWRFLAALSGFWLLDARGVWQLAAMTAMLLAGFEVPLDWFPDGLVGLLRATPFAAMAQLPTEIFLGRHRSAADLGAIVARQAAWAAVLLLAGRWLAARAFRKVVVQGG